MANYPPNPPYGPPYGQVQYGPPPGNASYNMMAQPGFPQHRPPLYASSNGHPVPFNNAAAYSQNNQYAQHPVAHNPGPIQTSYYNYPQYPGYPPQIQPPQIQPPQYQPNPIPVYHPGGLGSHVPSPSTLQPNPNLHLSLD